MPYFATNAMTHIHVHAALFDAGESELLSAVFLVNPELSLNRLYAVCGAVGIRTVLGRSNCNLRRHSHNSGVHFSGQHGVRQREYLFFSLSDF